MINFEKTVTVTLIDIMSKVTENEIKSMMKNQLAGVMSVPRFIELSRCIGTIFGINSKSKIKEIQTEMEAYYGEMKEKSRKHIKDAMKDDWGWLNG